MKPLNKRLRKGEAAAFAELYELLGEKVYRYVYSQLGNSQDASDVIQEAFVQLVKSHRSLGAAKNLNAYVFRTARNEVIRWLQKQKRHQHTEEQRLFESRSPKSNDVDSDDWVNNVLKELDPVDREIVSLKAISKLTFSEVAEVTGIAKSNVATRYRRCMLRLKQQLLNQQSNEHPPTTTERNNVKES